MLALDPGQPPAGGVGVDVTTGEAVGAAVGLDAAGAVAVGLGAPVPPLEVARITPLAPTATQVLALGHDTP